MAHLTINGRTIEALEGSTVLQACRHAGIEVPTLCDDERLQPAGVCRLCLVQVRGLSHLAPACCTRGWTRIGHTHRTRWQDSADQFVLSCGACADTCPTGAIEDQSVPGTSTCTTATVFASAAATAKRSFHCDPTRA